MDRGAVKMAAAKRKTDFSITGSSNVSVAQHYLLVESPEIIYVFPLSHHWMSTGPVYMVTNKYFSTYCV